MNRPIAASLIALALAWSSASPGQQTAPPDGGVADEEFMLSERQMEAELDKDSAQRIGRGDFPDTAAQCGMTAGFLSRVGKDRNDETLRTQMATHADFWYQFMLGRFGPERTSALAATSRTWLQDSIRKDGLPFHIRTSENMMTSCKSYERVIRRQSQR